MGDERVMKTSVYSGEGPLMESDQGDILDDTHLVE